jgi:hypothetical protein
LAPKIANDRRNVLLLKNQGTQSFYCRFFLQLLEMANSSLRAVCLLKRVGDLTFSWQSIGGRQAVKKLGKTPCVASMTTKAAAIQHQYTPNKYPESEVLLATSEC